MTDSTMFQKIPRPRLSPNSMKFPKINSHASSLNYNTETFTETSIPYCCNSNEEDSKKYTELDSFNDQMSKFRSDIIGEEQVFCGPFGPRKCVYMDQTASGRSIKSVENFIEDNVLPIYGNTHTTTSYFASQISAYRNESREIIKKSCGGNAEDELIFCGSGATGGVHKLVHSIRKPGDYPPIVLIGPFEHHSNILPWRESARKVINIPEDAFGKLDMQFLEKVLKKVKAKTSNKKSLLVGVFSAASNVTGVLTDDVAVTALMHKYEGFAFWDYAAAAPHVQINMNPTTGDEVLDLSAKKDAIFFSGHKFMGGPQTTGILIAKKHVFRNPVPHAGGGGTVLFVTEKRHKYLEDIETREEGGTPEIVGSIRLGLVFQLKNAIGISHIMDKEAYFTRKALKIWGSIPEIIILGNNESPRVPIISLMIKHVQSGYFLHHDFVTALLNDLFGIQCRGGCMCAGPYSQVLLGIDEPLAEIYEKILGEPSKPVGYNKKPTYDMIFKPGFIRLSIPFHSSEEETDFVIQAVKIIALHGWKLLPYYKFNSGDGTFRCTSSLPQNQYERDTISSFKLQNASPKPSTHTEYLSYEESLKYAQSCCDNMAKALERYTQAVDDTTEFLPKRRPFRWFMLPSEAFAFLKNPNSNIRSPSPFHPKDNYQIFYSEDVFDSQDRLTSQWCFGSIPYQITSIWMKDNKNAIQQTIPENAHIVNQLAGILQNTRLNKDKKLLRVVHNPKHKLSEDFYDSDALDISRSSSSSGFHSDFRES